MNDQNDLYLLLGEIKADTAAGKAATERIETALAKQDERIRKLEDGVTHSRAVVLTLSAVVSAAVALGQWAISHWRGQ